MKRQSTHRVPSFPESTIRFLVAACTVLMMGAIPSQSAVVFSDNFDLAGPVNLDGSDQTGRRLGLLANDVVTRSALQQHTIVDQQLRLNNTFGPQTKRVRFHDENNLANRWDFSSGVAGQAMLDSRGFTVIFDYTAPTTSSTNWISWNVGINPAAAEPSFRVNDSQTDFGILFRDNGGTQVFDNGVAGVGNGFTNSAGSRHVVIDFTTQSWADGAGVLVNASVDGTSVLTNYPFQWDNNAGVINFELGTLQNGALIHNFEIVTHVIPEPQTAAMTLIGMGILLMARKREEEYA